MVMYDGSPSENLQFAESRSLTFPILSDTSMELFERWDPSGSTPSSTLLDRGLEVHAVDTSWYTSQLEALIYEE